MTSFANEYYQFQVGNKLATQITFAGPNGSGILGPYKPIHASMMKFLTRQSGRERGQTRAFTLAETCISTALATMLMGTILYGYVMSVKKAEWSAYALSAHSLAMMRLEQTRAAQWDPLGYPPRDELVSTNFPVSVETLDIPITGTNVVYATNTITISMISTNPPLKMIQIVCQWPFMGQGVYSNVIVTYRAPDQ